MELLFTLIAPCDAMYPWRDERINSVGCHNRAFIDMEFNTYGYYWQVYKWFIDHYFVGATAGYGIKCRFNVRFE